MIGEPRDYETKVLCSYSTTYTSLCPQCAYLTSVKVFQYVHLQAVYLNRTEGKQRGIARSGTCLVTYNLRVPYIAWTHCLQYTISVKNALLWRVKKSVILVE